MTENRILNKPVGRRRVLAGLSAALTGVVGGYAVWPPYNPVGDRIVGDGITLVVRQHLRYDGVTSLDWSPDSRRLASYGIGGNGYAVWDPLFSAPLHVLHKPWAPYTTLAPVRFNGDSRTVFVEDNHQKINGAAVGFGLWNVETGRVDRTVMFPESYYPKYGDGWPVVIPVPGRKQAVASFENFGGEAILVYDTDTWEIVAAPIKTPPAGARCIKVSPDGRLLAIGGGVLGGPDRMIPWGQVFLYDLASGAMVRQIDRAHIVHINRIAFSPDGRYIASAGSEMRKTYRDRATGSLKTVSDAESIRIWDVATGEMVAGITDAWDRLAGLHFHPSGRWLAGGVVSQKEASEFRIWDWRRGTVAVQIRMPRGREILREVAFSPDGKYVAIGWLYRSNQGWIQILEIMSS